MRTLERAREGGDPYQARVASEDRARVAFHAVWTDIDHVLDTDPDLWNHPWTEAASRQEMRDRLVSAELVAAYVAIIPCVEALVRIQLDHQRRDGHDGRWARVTPRLAETFRKQLSDSGTREVFGPMIEAEIRAGYAGAAAVLAGIARPMEFSPELRLEDLEYRALSGHDGLPDRAHRVLSCCSLHREIDEVGHERGLVAGRLASTRDARRHQLWACSRYWNSAGAALFAMTSIRRRRADPGAPALDRAGPRPDGGPRGPLAAEASLDLR